MPRGDFPSERKTRKSRQPPSPIAKDVDETRNNNLQRFLESLPIWREFEEGEEFVKRASGQRAVLHSFKARNAEELTVRENQLVLSHLVDSKYV
jgi:hypothetical protein